MSVLVTDRGFVRDDWRLGYVPLAAVSDACTDRLGPGVDLSTPVLSPLEWARLSSLLPRVPMIRINLRHFGDTDAYDLARALRRAGYHGRIRARGAMLARCYTLARRAGFDEVELAPGQARLQPSEHWRFEVGWVPGARAKPAGSADNTH